MVAVKWLASKWLRLAIIAGLSCLLLFILVSLPRARRTAKIFYLLQEGPVNELDQHNRSTSDQYSNDGPNPNHDSPVVENQWIDSDSKGVKINSNYPSPVENQWIDIDSKGVTMVRRTVYYDLRQQSSPSIVIILLHNHEKMLAVPQFHAKVTLATNENFCTRVQHWKQTGNIVRSFKELALNHVLRINMSSHLHETAVSVQLSKNPNCNEDSLWPIMPVFHDKRQRDNVFTTCVQKALFGTITPAEIVSFVELNKALGASIITIFFSQRLKDPSKTYKAIEPYVKSGLVEVLSWTLKHEWTGIFDLGMAASATECVYRNIHRSKYMALHDIDEYLIPMKHLDWSRMISELRTGHNLTKYASLSFSNSIFQEKIKKSRQNNCESPIYFKRFWRDANPSKGHPKVMVDLDTTITAYCHDIKTWKDGVSKKFDVPPHIGLLFHYRKYLGHRVKKVKKWIKDTRVNKWHSVVYPSIMKQVPICKDSN